MYLIGGSEFWEVVFPAQKIRMKLFVVQIINAEEIKQQHMVTNSVITRNVLEEKLNLIMFLTVSLVFINSLQKDTDVNK